jgi:thioredoxin-like negative regulator of GroEL
MKLLKFEAEWCGPCSAMDRELDKCNSEFTLVRVNIEKDTGVTRLYNVRAVPTLILLDDNDIELARLAGRQNAASIDRFVNDAA